MTPPVVPRIEKCADPLLPQFLFEWHLHIGKVYCVKIPGRFEGGEFVRASDWSAAARGVVIAEHCEHHARFLGFVQTWTRGYKQAVVEYPTLEGSLLLDKAIQERLSLRLLKGETDG